MFLEDQLTVAAIIFSLTGIFCTFFLLESQIPITATIESLSDLPEQTRVVFKARIEKTDFLKEFDRLELDDGNKVTAILSKNQKVDWKNHDSIFEFKAQIIQKEPSIKLRILEVRRID